MNTARINIAYVVHTLNPGGTERLVVDMSLAFSSSYCITVFCLDEPGSWSNELRERGIAVHCLWRQPGFDISVALRLAKYFRQLDIDIVHAHQCTPWFYAALSRLRFRKPQLILEEHGRFFPEVGSPLRRWVNRLLIRKLTRKFVAVSEDIRERLVRYEGLDHDEIDVIYNGVAKPPVLSDEQREALRATFGFTSDDFVVGTVGRFDSIKNLPMLIQAIHDNFEQIQSLRGLIVGDGPEFEKIESLLTAKNMSDRVRLSGFRSDATDLAQCMDLFVLSSFSEGTSMALLEAMAGSVPVAVTAVGGNPEIVSPDDTGWLVPSNDTAALAGVIKEAFADDDKREGYGLAGRRRYESQFTVDTMLANYADIYVKLSSRRTAPR